MAQEFEAIITIISTGAPSALPFVFARLLLVVPFGRAIVLYGF